MEDKYYIELKEKALKVEIFDKARDYAEIEVKQYYDNKDFKMLDVKDVAKGTPREDELFDYANVPD